MSDREANSSDEVEELRDRVETLENQLAKMMPNRRSVLGSIAGVAAAGSAGYYLGTEQAAAAPDYTSSTGQLGTSSDPLQEVISKTVTAQTLSTDKVVIGGTLFEEDDNSPIDKSGTSSITYTLSDSSRQIVVIPDTDVESFFNELQINGDTNGNYDIIDESGSTTAGKSQIDGAPVSRWNSFTLVGYGSEVQFIPQYGGAQNETVSARNTNISAPITKFTMSHDGGSNQSYKGRVYRRVMSV